MRDVNKMTLSGNTVDAAKVVRTASGKVGSLVIAHNERPKNGEPTTTFVTCVAFGTEADYLETIPKGKHVVVEGRIKQSRWLSKKDGEQRTALECIVSSIWMTEKATRTTGQPDPRPAAGETKNEGAEVPW